MPSQESSGVTVTYELVAHLLNRTVETYEFPILSLDSKIEGSSIEGVVGAPEAAVSVFNLGKYDGMVISFTGDVVILNANNNNNNNIYIYIYIYNIYE